MIKIITIEREYGSGGGEIAQLVAQQLGWKLWDQLLTEEIAKLANCPKAVVEVREERTDPLYYRLFKSFLRGSYEGSLNAHKLNVIDSESILKITRRVVEQVSKEGNSVLVGRGSQQFLRDRQDTLRVFLYAPREDKVRRLISSRQESSGSRTTGRYRRPRAQGFYSKVFRRRMAGPRRLPHHDQHHHRQPGCR